MSRKRVVVIGAGAGGLAAAVDLARRGAEVTVVERAAAPGGKLRTVEVRGAQVDAGPTVFTMRWIFEALFADAGQRLEDHLRLEPLEILARHAWRQGGRLDLYADSARTEDAIGAFAGAGAAQGYRDFCRRSADIYRTLAATFIAAERPTPAALARRIGLRKLDALWRIAPLQTLWNALAEHFTDPRLRQLFARYATYLGSSPLLAPATLMLVAHVEREGVWRVRGGMRRIADALQALGAAQGARYRYGSAVARIRIEAGRVAGVVLADGDVLDAEAVIHNGDISALADGLLGPAVQRAAPRTPTVERSLSAITWCVKGRTTGFPLAHHNVFFAEDYPREFEAIFGERRIAAAPTVYVCAQDRADGPLAAPADAERLLLLINAPADGDRQPIDTGELARCAAGAAAVLDGCGLTIVADARDRVATTPSGFEQLFPATGGALYGRASHGAMATFKRGGAATSIPGLYAAGGSVHPGPGVPMAVMSGRIAAARVLQDFAGRSGKPLAPAALGAPPPALQRADHR